MNDKPLLEEIEDELFANDLHKKVKADQFAAGLPIVYQEDDTDMNCEWYILEYADGTRKRIHQNDLDKV